MIDQDHGSVTRILKTLRSRPGGMTITEIAKKTRITRNSISKHLEVLRVAGQVDMRLVGSAKVYSLAQRVPMSAFLCFTRNLILVLDNYGNIVQINDQFLNLAGLKKDEILGENIRDVSLSVVSTPETIAIIESMDREQITTDVRYQQNDIDSFYQMEVIPTVFDDGERGCTIVLEDITEKKRYIQNMEFLAKTAMEFVDLPEEVDVYQRIAELLLEFIPEAQVFISSFDDIKHQFIIRAVIDQDFRDALTSLIGHDPVGMVFPLDEVFLSPFLENPDEIQKGIRELRVAPKPGEGLFTFYELAFRQIPEKICEEIVLTRNIGKAYLAFLAWKGQLLGDIGVFMSPHDEIVDIQALDSFIRQASIAISKRMTEEQLRRSNKRFKEVVELSPFPAAIIDSNGHYTFINHKFTEIFGYTLQEIPTGQDWFQKAFPGAELRNKVIDTWKSDLEESGVNQVPSRTYQVQCKDGEIKTIQSRTVTLCDHTQYITYEDVTELRQAHQILLSEIAELRSMKR